MYAIEARRLVRKFGDFVAVAGVEFEVRQGEVFGFLGPNGAGKSTTINFIKLTGHAIRASEADATQPLRQMARMWTGTKR